MCLPSWLYRSLHSGRVMGHCFLSFAAHLSFQNYCLKIRIGVKKKICATNCRTNILCKNWKIVGKAVAAAWNPSKPGFDTCAITRCWLFTQFLSEKCIFCILCLVPFFWQFRKLHRRPSIYQCVCHRMTLLDFISIHEWKKRIVANRCVGVDLVLPNF